ncbi:thioesterase family protein [Oceanobacillus iheyensis]|uniref:thioesterase family protein n=1 Tax=Oceanobacillus iheyensis TaxID=182710 RepID=UPI003629C620
MKEGLNVGYQSILEIEVTEDMFAQFGDEVVHPAYSTASMVYHMEWVSRDLLLPFLKEQEESVGAAVKLKHIAPSALGTKVKLEAVVTSITEKQVVTKVIARNESVIIGEGEVKQSILPKNTMKSKLDIQIAAK